MFNITQGATFLYDTPPFPFTDINGDTIDLTQWELEAWAHFADAGRITKPIAVSISTAETKFVVSLRAEAADTLKWPPNSWGEVKIQFRDPISGTVQITPPMPILVEAATPVRPQNG